MELTPSLSRDGANKINIKKSKQQENCFLVKGIPSFISFIIQVLVTGRAVNPIKENLAFSLYKSCWNKSVLDNYNKFAWVF